MILASKVPQPIPPSSNTSGKTVLVVDDDESVASFFQMLVGSVGVGVITVHSGEEALLKLKESSPRKIDLVVLDLMMPPPGGYEIIKKMQDGDHQNAPVFVVSARDLDAGTSAMLKLESNVKSVWKKPVDQDAFKAQLMQTLGMGPKA